MTDVRFTWQTKVRCFETVTIEGQLKKHGYNVEDHIGVYFKKILQSKGQEIKKLSPL